MDALILVDIQNDFIPGGALPVPNGDEIVPVVNRLQSKFDLIVATQDWHPPKHSSFAASHLGKNPGDWIELDGFRQVLWPVHCVQGTQGADFAPGLNQSRWGKVIFKGTDPAIDSYSGFYDNGHRKTTGLGAYFWELGVNRVYVLGLASDYCVKFTALDACGLGFDTWVVKDACRGVDLHTGDVKRAMNEMTTAGVRLVSSHEMLKKHHE